MACAALVEPYKGVSVRRISQPKLLSLREEETRGEMGGGGETGMVVGGKVPESVGCMRACVCEL